MGERFGLADGERLAITQHQGWPIRSAAKGAAESSGHADQGDHQLCLQFPFEGERFSCPAKQRALLPAACSNRAQGWQAAMRFCTTAQTQVAYR